MARVHLRGGGAKLTFIEKYADHPFAVIMYCIVQNGCFERGKVFEYSFQGAQWVLCTI